VGRCPLCRAVLNGAETCRRCKAELQTVRRVEREGQTLLGAAMHHLALGDPASSRRLLRLAIGLHATPEARALWGLVGAAQPCRPSVNDAHVKLTAARSTNQSPPDNALAPEGSPVKRQPVVNPGAHRGP
jgi:hypothetical protein